MNRLGPPRRGTFPAMDPFAAETFLCLELPAPVAERVLRIRRAHGDAFRAVLPVEVTVAGSGGLGAIAAGQDPATVFAAVDTVAAATSPIVARFGPVRRIPGADIFVLTLVEETPFRILQKRLAESGIRFAASPFPFTPHCTLRSRSPVTAREARALLRLRITESCVLEVLTVYALTGVAKARLQAGEGRHDRIRHRRQTLQLSGCRRLCPRRRRPAPSGGGIDAGRLAVAGVIFVGLLVAGRAAIRASPVYVVLGLGLWLAFLESGVHTSIDGVLLALTIPLRSASGSTEGSLLVRWEHALVPWVAFVIVPIFALANAGVALGGDALDTIGQPVALGVVAGLLLGKQLGITLTT